MSVPGQLDVGLGAREAHPGGGSALTGGGTDGNEELTARAGLILIVLLAVLGVTIIQIGALIWLHLFLGLLLVGPLVLKMGSAGYRFARYYTRAQTYRDKGPPELWLRLLAPAVVITNLVVFASGVVLLLDGPRSRGIWLTIHKASFFVWLGAVGLHVLGHLSRLPRQLRTVEPVDGLGSGPPGRAGRWILIAGSLLGGAVLAIVLIPHFGVWTASGALHHHHHAG